MTSRYILCSSTSFVGLASDSLANCFVPAASLSASTYPSLYVAQQFRGFAAPSKSVKDAAAKKMKPGAQDSVDHDNPRLKPLLALLSSPDRKDIPPTPEELASEIEYRRALAKEREAWSRDMQAKFKLQQAALHALPERLRTLAMQPDHTPFPLNRKFLFDTPPESYRDGLAAQVAKQGAAIGGR